MFMMFLGSRGGNAWKQYMSFRSSMGRVCVTDTFILGPRHAEAFVMTATQGVKYFLLGDSASWSSKLEPLTP